MSDELEQMLEQIDQPAGDLEDPRAAADVNEEPQAAETPSTTDELLQKLADMMSAKPEAKPEEKQPDGPPEYKFPGLAIPDDVLAALDSEDPAQRHKALNHLQNSSVSTALAHYNDHMMKTVFPMLAQGLFQAITSAVQEQTSGANAKEQFFKDNEDLAAFNSEEFAPILNKLHADVSKKFGVRWSPEVAKEMAKRLRDVTKRLSGKDTAPPKPAQKLNGGTAVRQSTTSQTTKPGELPEAELRSFFV